MSYVLDTNAALYWLKGMSLDPLPTERLFISVITELELLGYPFTSEAEEQGVLAFLKCLEIVDLSETIKQHAINLRRSQKIKLPDAIIAATALALNATLLTNDETLIRIPLLRCVQLRLRV